ncbi:MAG: hypothetical protein AAF413_00365 [Patescibacteria group bacterium]
MKKQITPKTMTVLMFGLFVLFGISTLLLNNSDSELDMASERGTENKSVAQDQKAQLVTKTVRHENGFDPNEYEGFPSINFAPVCDGVNWPAESLVTDSGGDPLAIVLTANDPEASTGQIIDDERIELRYFEGDGVGRDYKHTQDPLHLDYVICLDSFAFENFDESTCEVKGGSGPVTVFRKNYETQVKIYSIELKSLVHENRLQPANKSCPVTALGFVQGPSGNRLATDEEKEGRYISDNREHNFKDLQSIYESFIEND